MPWPLLYFTVEGQTERNFVHTVLLPHLAIFSIEAKARVVITNRQLGMRGGIYNYQKIRDDLTSLMLEDQNPEARFTTMIDFYGLPRDFPGWDAARRKKSPSDRVTILEQAFKADLVDARFFPHIQLHEFETLLYCDLRQLQSRITGSATGITKLGREVAGMSPEEINEGRETAPSKRIIRHVPAYAKSKVRVGPPSAAAMGLHILRSKCPHFNTWISSLEALA